MLDKTIAKNVLAKALCTGGNFAELFIENEKTNNISLVNGKVDKVMTGINYGIGIRIFSGYNAIYAYTNDLSESNLLRVAYNAASAISKHAPPLVVLDFKKQNINNIHPIKIMPQNVSKNDIIAILREADGVSKAYSSQITSTMGNYLDRVQEVAIINSEGLWAEDTRVRTQISVHAVASSDEEKQWAGFTPGAHKGYELLEGLDIKELATQSAHTAAKMLSADYAPKGKMPVIIDNGFGGVIFHEACGHSLEATSIAKGASEFYGKKGTQIASSIVTAIDDGTVPNAWGSQNIDDEGTKTQKNVLIENGILKTYLVDRLNGLKMDEQSTGSSRRESYEYAPTSRMTNTYIQAGTDDEKDIIKATEHGFYAKKMGGGSVTPATGEFNFAVLEGYLIKDGEIKEPLRGASLIGKGSEVLMDIDKIGKIEDHAQGMCGSISGAVPTNIGQPMIRVKKMTVGGRN